jgi:WD40 repeat protein
VSWAAFSPDGKQILTLSSRQELSRFLQVAEGKVSIVSTRSAMAHDDTLPPIHVWDAANGRLLHTVRDLLNPHIGWEKPLAWSHDGQWIAAGQLNGVIDLPQRKYYVLPGVSSLGAALFSPNGRYLISNVHRRLNVCDLATLEPAKGRSGGTIEVRTFGEKAEQKVEQIPHGQYRACRTVELAGDDDPIASVAFSGDSRWIVTTGERMARIWKAETGAKQHELRGHLRTVRKAVFSPDGRFVATASDDFTARIWLTDSGKEFFTLHGHQGPVHSIDFSPDSRYLLTSSHDGTARLWPIDPLLIAQDRLPRELTADERMRFDVPFDMP